MPIARTPRRAPAALPAAALTFALCVALVPGARAQQSQAPVPQAPAPQAGGGRGGPPKNLQVLKDIPQEQLGLTMQYIAASLGVQCTYCHVQGQNDLDDKEPKKIARDMMKMVADVNGKFFDGKERLSCASCHDGRAKPVRTPPLAIEMTPAQAAAAAAGRGSARAAGPGGPGAARGRGTAEPQASPEPSGSVDEVVAKYIDALGGAQALQAVRTRVMTGTVTSRDLVTTPATVQEKATGEYRIDVATTPIPTIRAYNGRTAWAVGGPGGGGGRGGPGAQPAPDAPRDLAGFQLQQALRLADLALPLTLKTRYQGLAVNKTYDAIDGRPVVVLTGKPYPDVTEQLSFDRQSGLLLRRTVTTTGVRLMALPEQIDYSDYRDVGGIKVPFTVRHTTWNAVTTLKYGDVRANAPVADDVFAKPAVKP